MLAKKFRLPIQSALNKSGRSLKSRYFLFKLFPNQLNFNRFGVIISKKVAKEATKRNRIKRIIFDACRDNIFSKQEIGKDVLIIVSPTVSKLQKTDIIKELDELLSKI